MKTSFLLLLVVTVSSVNVRALSYYQQNNEAVEDSMAQKYAGYEDNRKCFSCHGTSSYEIKTPDSDKKIRRIMPKNRIVSKKTFYNSVHHNFACTDCHSYEFNTFPHPANLIFEEYPNCIDCHGGDETFAKYHFEEIEKEYKESVHYAKEGKGFTCWKCHDPHAYIPTARRSNNIEQIVSFSNDMCLKCHANAEEFRLFSDSKELDIVKVHSWLPNQALHFTKVRCIECHTQINDTILVAHMVLPKTKAVQRCRECHSQNSLLMATLYKFRTREERKRTGFINSIIINESYVIGANRNTYLNTLSIIILVMTIIGILIHLTIRFFTSKKR